MSAEVEIWFDSPPPLAALAEALSGFGALVELRDGTLRLVEGDEEPRDGVPFTLDTAIQAPAPVRELSSNASACLRASAVLSGSRGFWMGRVAAELQKRLGGVIYVPPSGRAYADAASYEASWPADHPAHDLHDGFFDYSRPPHAHD